MAIKVSGTTVIDNSRNIDNVPTLKATTIEDSTFKDYGETVNSVGNTGASATIDLANGNFATATLTDNCTFTFTLGTISSNVVSFTLFLTNDATPSRTITWPASVKWPGAVAPARTETANRTDVYNFFTYDGGTTWYGILSIYNYS